MTGFQATWAIVQDSMVELISIICAVSLSKCLMIPLPTLPSLIASRRPWADFMTSSYSLATLCIPMIFGGYYNNKNKTSKGCLREDQEALLPSTEDNDEDAPTTPIHQFPVIFIFFTIASISLGFMQYQGQKQQANVNDILKLQHDLRIQLELKKKQ
jgi:hypothetical protein